MNLFVEVNEHSLYTEMHGPGEGPAVVLLHHGLGSVRAWKAQIPALAEAGFRVIAYDRRGYGASSPRAGLSPPFFKEDREDLYLLLEALGVKQAALIGHSDGGTIALYFAADHPERVSRLVTAAAHIYVEEKMKAGIEGVRESYETDERFRKRLRRLHGNKTGQVFDGWYSGWQRPENLTWDLRPILPRIACPALIIQGMEDEHATPQHALDIAAGIPGSELCLEPEMAHRLPQERPEKFNERVVKFLKRETIDDGRKTMDES